MEIYELEEASVPANKHIMVVENASTSIALLAVPVFLRDGQERIFMEATRRDYNKRWGQANGSGATSDKRCKER